MLNLVDLKFKFVLFIWNQMLAMTDYAKYLRKHPELKPCVVSITRESEIEAMAEACTLPIRRSERLIKIQMNGNKVQKSITAKKSCSTPKSSGRAQSRLSLAPKPTGQTKNRSSLATNLPGRPRNRSTLAPVSPNRTQNHSSLASNSPDQNHSTPVPKSILAPNGNSRLRGRAKSVSFDPAILSPVSNTSQSNGMNVQPQTAAANQITDYENRIESLIASNRTKMNRHKELIVERGHLLKQIEDLHRMNFILTKAVDDLRAGLNNQTQNGK